jgi:phage tail-like protein
MPGAGGDPILGQSFYLDLQGAISGYFTQCDGLSSENEVIVNKSVDAQGRTRIRKIPGPISFGNIKLSKGITADLALWDWVKKVAEGEIGDSRRNGSISLVDPKGTVVAKWELLAAWPVRVTGPSMNAESGQVGVEELELAIEGFHRVPV